MNPTLQHGLLSLYRLVQRTGVLSTKPGRAAFDFAYGLYKDVFEAGPVTGLKPFVTPGSVVIDVGANVGFFTTRFARWAGPEGKVIAIEPESLNFDFLKRNLDRQALGATVEPLLGAAAESSGIRHLVVNPDHPGDHRLSADGKAQQGGRTVQVQAWSLDDLLAERGWPAVSLIKIDVQGAEESVLEGARGILDRFHPALFVEVDEAALARMGSSARALFARLAGHGYAIHDLTETGVSAPLPAEEALTRLQRPGSYFDFLFLARV